jgi:hypothetical protein
MKKNEHIWNKKFVYIYSIMWIFFRRLRISFTPVNSHLILQIFVHHQMFFPNIIILDLLKVGSGQGKDWKVGNFVHKKGLGFFFQCY